MRQRAAANQTLTTNTRNLKGCKSELEVREGRIGVTCLAAHTVKNAGFGKRVGMATVAEQRLEDYGPQSVFGLVTRAA